MRMTLSTSDGLVFKSEDFKEGRGKEKEDFYTEIDKLNLYKELDKELKTELEEGEERDLDTILIKTFKDLQVMKDNYENGVDLLNHIILSHTLEINMIKDYISTAVEHLNVGLKLHSSLLRLLGSACDQMEGAAELLASQVKEELQNEENELKDGELKDDEEMTIKVEPELYLEEELKTLADDLEKAGRKHRKLKNSGNGDSEEIDVLPDSDRRYPCHICGKAFKRKEHVHDHLKSVHSNLRPYTCELCKKSFKLKSTLTKHRWKVHNIKPSVKQNNNVEEEEDNDTDNLAIKVENQHNTFPNGNTEHDTGDGDHGLPEYRKELISTDENNERRFPCDMCEKAFKRLDHLEDHRNSIHSNRRPYKCEMCDKDFKLKPSLKKHQRNIHKIDTPEENIFCTENYDDSYKYKKSKAIKCEICHKKFYQGIERHIKFVHNCDYCEKIFVTLIEKRQHMKSMHKPNMVVCDFCGIEVLKSYLKKHVIQHTGEKPHKCDICDNRFYTKFNLKHHMYLHTGEKPFECDVCKKRFCQKAQLKNHYRLHTGEKPFECNHCGKAFHLGGERNKHVKKFHGGIK